MLVALVNMQQTSNGSVTYVKDISLAHDEKKFRWKY